MNHTTDYPMRSIAVLGVCATLIVLPLGCENLPGTARGQGAVVGGVAGAAAGAMIAKENRLLGALIGAAVGAGGGYLIGTTIENAESDDEDKQEAREAARRAMEDPATAADARGADTADVNEDGFVTMDEILAMKEAGFDDDEMIERLKATDQVFELTAEQENYLVDRGVSRTVTRAMRSINLDEKSRILGDVEEEKDDEDARTDVIGSEQGS